MTISKSILTISSIAVAAMFGGGVYMVMNLGSLAEKIVERVGTQTLGVAVDIGHMDVSLQDRRVVVSGLDIANPPGFKHSKALSVDTISIVLGSVSKGLISFDDITVQGTQVYMEVKENTTNIQMIKDNIKIKPPAAKEEGAEELKVIINRLALSQAKLNPTVTLLSAQDLAPITVPDILLTGVGKKENGILVNEAIAQVWQHLSTKFSSAASGAGFYEGMSSEALKEIGATQMKNFKDQVNEGVNEFGKSLKGLFE